MPHCIIPCGNSYSVIRMELTSRAALDSLSISTVRVRASDQDDIGGLNGTVCVLPSRVWKVISENEMSVIVGERAVEGERPA